MYLPTPFRVTDSALARALIADHEPAVTERQCAVKVTQHRPEARVALR